jgi:adenylate cyclase
MIEAHWLRVVPFIAAQFALFVAMPLVAQTMGQDTYGMPAVGWVAGWVIAYSSAGSAARAVGAEQRRFAQSALGKYLPRDIAQQIIIKPELLALHGEKREIFALFSDLEGFTKLSHAIEPEMVATLLNRYLDMLSAVVLAHGGVIDKFVGDAVVAFWGAPIARPDDGANAARAAYAMWQAGETFRRTAPEGVPPIGKTRVGLHFGEAIVGNFGGEGRIQYTALGDSMNTAARLESANKPLGSNVLASREAMERSTLDWWRPMGRVILRGRATPIEIFEPAPDFPAEARKALANLLAMPQERHGERLAGLDALARQYPGDAALAHLLMRETTCRDGEAYELG